MDKASATLLKRIGQPAVYSLSDPVTDQIRYVGQTVNVYSRTKRYWSASAHGSNPHLNNWLRKLKRNGLDCQVHILELVERPEELDEAERRQIARAKVNGWKLTNKDDGGTAGSRNFDKQRLAKMSANAKSYWARPEYRERMLSVIEQTAASKMGLTVEQYRERRQAEREAVEQRKQERERQRQERLAEQQRDRDLKQQTPTLLTFRGKAVVPLTLGLRAVVSAEDAERVAAHSWHAQRKVNTNGKVYWRAIRTIDSSGSGCKQLLNRFVMDATDGQFVRHANGDQLDCTRGNLRISQKRVAVTNAGV